MQIIATVTLECDDRDLSEDEDGLRDQLNFACQSVVMELLKVPRVTSNCRLDLPGKAAGWRAREHKAAAASDEAVPGAKVGERAKKPG